MGKPSRRDGRLPASEYIGCVEGTRGSETSQYPQEEKTTVIPSVAASERGTGQTNEVYFVGVEDIQHGCNIVNEESWKAPP